MGLCPNFCECKPCKHSVRRCQTCKECIRSSMRQQDQKKHDDSIRRQRGRLKIAPWRKDDDEG